jgi:hypothetical protein
MNETRHPQRQIALDGLFWAPVDEQLSYAILGLWKLGIITYYSCQGDAFFKDETQYENRKNRGYILMDRSPVAMLLVSELVKNFKPLYADRTLWDIEFFNRPMDDRQQICIRFPNADIEALTEFIETQVLHTDSP